MASSGVQLLLAAVYLTARYCTAQELLNTAVKYHFWKTFQKHTAKSRGGQCWGQTHLELFGATGQIHLFDFFEPLFPFPGT